MNIETDISLSAEEREAILAHPSANGAERATVTVGDTPDELLVAYHYHPSAFERIRRITGYLTGSLETWNDAKRAEERDRVKHGEGLPE